MSYFIVVSVKRSGVPVGNVSRLCKARQLHKINIGPTLLRWGLDESERWLLT